MRKLSRPESLRPGTWKLPSTTSEPPSSLTVNKGVTGEYGDYRRHDIVIVGASIRPPSPFHVPDWMSMYVKWIREHLGDEDFTEFLTKGYVLFECIHPFPDGNGRTKGLPPVVIKGDKGSRERYIRALQIAEEPLREIVEGRPDRELLEEALVDMGVGLMKEMEKLPRALKGAGKDHRKKYRRR